MASSNYSLTVIYNNLYTFFNYRKLLPLDKQLSNDEFLKNIFNNDYFVINTILEEYKDKKDEIISTLKGSTKNISNVKITYILLFHYKSELYYKTADLKKILNKFKKIQLPYEIILITKNKISTHVETFIKTLTNIKFYLYTFKLFTIIPPKHILVPKHTILTQDEANHLLKEVLFCHKHNLPIISINDPQIIWSSGKIGDIVEIERNDDVSCKSLYYRVIVDIVLKNG